MRLIDADKLKRDLIAAVYSANNPKGVAEVIKIVEDQPTAYDVRALEQQRQVAGMNKREAIIQLEYEATSLQGMLQEGGKAGKFANKRVKALDMAIEALEKQVAKNVITIHSIKEDVNVGNVAFRKGCKLTKCPVCGKFLSNDKYCRYCGQRLKWEV